MLTELKDQAGGEGGPGHFGRTSFRKYPRGEALLKQVKPNSPEWKAIIGPLTKMYLVLNQQLGLTCQYLNAPLQQWKWDHSEPLELLAIVFPGLEATEWYQRHLSMMLMPPRTRTPLDDNYDLRSSEPIAAGKGVAFSLDRDRT